MGSNALAADSSTLQFVMERLNKLPEEAHGCDFSRVKPWYLDGK